MNYCSHCGAPVELRIPAGDTRPRHTCAACGTVHYQNPKVVAGCLPFWEDGRVLLCRRAIRPRFGLWTLPGGFMENDETTLEAAVRETLEEANARVEVLGLHTVFNLPHVNQVYFMFLARLLDLDFTPGPESLEVQLFERAQVPWDALAFTTVRESLRLHYEDHAAGLRRVHVGDIRGRRDEPRIHVFQQS